MSNGITKCIAYTPTTKAPTKAAENGSVELAQCGEEQLTIGHEGVCVGNPFSVELGDI